MEFNSNIILVRNYCFLKSRKPTSEPTNPPWTETAGRGTSSQESMTRSWDHVSARSRVQHQRHPADEDRIVGQTF